jgi:hypothetical protein
MKNKFILDENIIICSSINCNEYGDPDYSSGTLLYQIAYNCHKILLTEKIYNRYLLQIERLKYEGEYITNAAISLLQHLMHNSDKIVWEEDSEIDLSSYEFDQDDSDYIKLAILRHCIFVTTDNSLIDDIKRSEIDTSNNFFIKRPEDAIVDTI